MILYFAQALFTLGSAHIESQQATFAVMASNCLVILCIIFLKISTLGCNTVSERGEKLCLKPCSNCSTLLKLFSTVLIYFLSTARQPPRKPNYTLNTVSTDYYLSLTFHGGIITS